MKTNLLLVVLLIALVSCNKSKKENGESIPLSESVDQKAVLGSRGFELMTQKCYICHFEKPDPAKKDQMIGPPMLRVQEHYKPSYPNKNAFVNAIMDMVKNPTEDKTLMPGAVKQFKLMPKLIYDDAELRLIAETIFDYNFGSAPAMGSQMMFGKLQLNNGKKWVLKKESTEQIDAVVEKINNFNSTRIEDYNQLGKEVFNDAKIILLDDSYSGDLFDQIHIFFNGLENNMHTLTATESKDEAEKQLTILKNKFKEFYNYFE